MFRAFLLGAASLAAVSAAQAADLIIPTTAQPVFESAGFDWSGFYVGARAGIEHVPQGDLPPVRVADPAALKNDINFGFVGAVAGVNFVAADPIVVGVEATADYVWNGDDDLDSVEFFINGRLGAIVSDNVLAYVLGGVGMNFTETEWEFDKETFALYQVGVGAEVAVTDAVSVRGEVVALGSWGKEYEFAEEDPLFDSAKASVGVFYHF